MNDKTRCLLKVISLFRIFLCFLFSTPVETVSAQQPLFTNLQHFGVEEGLPQSYISGIAQDKDGFIWLSTLDGLCRYDGRSFRTFKYLANDTAGLASNAIYNLAPQANNSITLFYDGLLADDFDMQRFKTTRNASRSKMRNIPNALSRMLSINNTSNQWLFVLANYKGVGWLNSLTGKIHYANKANGLLQQDTVTGMTQSPDGRLYLISEDGVQVSDTAQQNFEFIRIATSIKKHPTVLDPVIFYKNFSPVCLPGNKLAIYDRERIIVLDLNKKTSTVFSIPPQTKSGVEEVARILKADASGQLYFNHAGRIFRLTQKGELKLLWENTTDLSLHISSFFIDRSNVLWLSINAQGLFKIDLQALPFQSYAYQHNFISDIIRHAGANPATFPPYWSLPGIAYYFRQAYDSMGNLYVCYNYSGNTQVYQLNKQGLRLFTHLPSDAIYTAMVAMPNNQVWVFDQRHSVWYNWKTPESVPEKIQLDKESMRDMDLADARFIGGFLWITTYSHGLLQYDGSKRINRFTGPVAVKNMPRDLTEICPDPRDKNKFWIGSRGGGLILWDVQKGLQQIFTTEDGLPNNTIYCILPGKGGRIWCSTNKGIFRFDPASKQVLAFEKPDGLPGNEFNRAHKFIFPDGSFAFGGMDGYTIFNPVDFDVKKTSGDVQIQLTSLQINNQVQDPRLANSFIKEPVSAIRQIVLPYDKNYLRFEFAAMLFNHPQKIKYRYQLKEADADWIENGTNNIASYASLRPGNYTLLINATGNNGEWSSTIKEISIHIRPPAWATWWARLVYALMLAGLLRWYFVFRENRIRAKQSLAFEKREALRLREVDEMKDRFFSNITHEFRTPLTLIVTPLEKLAKDPSLPSAAINTIKTAQKNSLQLLRLINEFLDFSKLNNGQMKLKLSTGDLALFVADCVQSFEAAANEKNISLSYSAEHVEGLYLFDQEKWGRIITNLLGNALKFTPQNGTVSVSLKGMENGTTRLTIKDSGPGIPLDQQQKIFERFYQVDDSSVRTYGGTGIGLSLVKELTGIMKGNVSVESEPGSLTCFIVVIPVQKASVGEPVLVAPPGLLNGKIREKVMDADAPLLMVVEDNNELRAFLVESMRTHYRVIEAADGLQAWETIMEELPDIIISDIMMPGRDGFDLCQLCKSDSRTAHIGFILLTSKAAHEARMKGLQTGADDYITKPFHLDELEMRTANLLALQQKVRNHLKAQLLTTQPPKEIPAITDPFLQQLYKEMEAKLEDADLGVDYLCKSLGMSKSTLNRKLKSLLDISANDLIRQYRLQKATGLLSNGSDISTAAYKVGFSSPSYFSQCFREQYGITPSDYVSQIG